MTGAPAGRSRRLADPVLLVLLAVETAVQAVLPLPGDTVETVGSAVRRYNTTSLAEQIGERVLVALLLAVPFGLLPLLVRRNRRRSAGQPTRRGRVLGLFDSPWHRDPVMWTAALITAVPLLALPGLSGYGTETDTPGQPRRTTEVVTGSYLDVLDPLPYLAVGFAVVALLLALARLVFRLLGGERPWRAADQP